MKKLYRMVCRPHFALWFSVNASALSWIRHWQNTHVSSNIMCIRVFLYNNIYIRVYMYIYSSAIIWIVHFIWLMPNCKHCVVCLAYTIYYIYKSTICIHLYVVCMCVLIVPPALIFHKHRTVYAELLFYTPVPTPLLRVVCIAYSISHCTYILVNGYVCARI